MPVRLGIDIFLEQQSSYAHRRIAFATNDAATTSSFMPSRLALVRESFSVIKLFAPEHGLETIGDDGRWMPNGQDQLTGLPIISLYGDKLRPSGDDLADVDLVVADFPDVGCRFYTYLWTLTYLMEACAEQHKELIVLDRPNPVSGRMDMVEGPMLDEHHCSSFIGRWRMPLRHSCTMGEMAIFWQKHRFPNLRLTISKVEGWERSQFAQQWSWSFVPTSPAMVSSEAALLYPGLGLLEATNLSEGRGTAIPFRVAGAPWLDATSISQLVNSLDLPGVVARPVTFTPLAAKFQGEQCEGCMFHVTNPAEFRPVLSALLFLKLVRDHHPNHFKWSTYPTHVNPAGEQHLDKLLGIQNAGQMFELDFPEFRRSVEVMLDNANWLDEIAPFLLY